MRVTARDHSTIPARDRIARRWRLIAIAALAPLGACAPNRVIQSSSTTPDDYRARHPIVLAEQPVGVAFFAVNGGLDETGRARVAGLAREARTEGSGGFEILFPRGSLNEASQRAALPGIRKALAEGGARGYVSVGSYPVSDPAFPAPIRVSYRAIRARVSSTCGEWPRDLASASSLDGWRNEPYWNFGCSYQNMLAVQAADPRDHADPRAMAAGDVEMRIRAIGKVRQGSDPGTTWTTKNSNIGSIGGS